MNDTLEERDLLWAKAVTGDKDSFSRVTEPLLEELRSAARHEIAYYTALGDYEPDLIDADELVGEVLSRAWRDRKRKPPHTSLKAWLLGLVYRVADAIAARQRRLREVRNVSVESTVRDDVLYDDEESFYEWYQPDEVTRLEDVIADPQPTPEEIAAALEEAPTALEATDRRVLLLHDAHGLTLSEIGAVVSRSVEETREVLVRARRRIATG